MSLLEPLENEYKRKHMYKCRRPMRTSWICIGIILAFYIYGWFHLYLTSYPEPYRTKLMYNYFICGSIYSILMALRQFHEFITLLLATTLLLGCSIVSFPGITGYTAQTILLLDIIFLLLLIRGLLYAWEYESLKKELAKYNDSPPDESN